MRALEGWGAALRARLAPARHRRAVLLAGPPAWSHAAARALAADGVLWIGEAAPTGAEAVSRSSAAGLLGREADTVVIDLHEGFDPDSLGIAAGLVRGPGLLLLPAPPPEGWAGWADPERARMAPAGYGADAVGGRFLARLARTVRDDPGVLVLRAGAPPPPLPPPAAAAVTPASPDPDCLTADQATAVAALMRVVEGGRRRPAVLVADRGRGKSAALGIAAARVARAGREVVVTAARPQAAATALAHARRLLGAAASRVGFVPADELVRQPRPQALVLVDEAAALPGPVLEELLVRHPRIAFAATVHGYEGSGRGFEVRFLGTLRARTRGPRIVRLREPVRWGVGDPLEQWVFRALLLDAEPAAMPGTGAVHVEVVGRDRLAADEALLRQVFGLLVSAHYRTRPYDLRYLLDGPNLTVLLARECGADTGPRSGQVRGAPQAAVSEPVASAEGGGSTEPPLGGEAAGAGGGVVVGVAVLAEEGGFDEAEARAVWAGRCRPHGHLLPETLAAHLGLEEASRLRWGRIVRIAVHSARRRQGIGRALVAAARRHGLDRGWDGMGSSFGATPDLVAFWAGAGMRPARVSVRRAAASGEHSVLMLEGMSAAGRSLVDTACADFRTGFPRRLADPLQGLEPALAAALLRHAGAADWAAVDPAAWAQAAAFAWGRRIYEEAMPALAALLPPMLADPVTAPAPDEAAALVAKVLQGRSWAEVARRLGVPGRAQVVARFRKLLRPVLEARGGEAVQRVRARLGAVRQNASGTD